MEEDEERSGAVAPREDDHSNEDKLDQSLAEPLDSQVSEDVGVVVLPEMDDSELVNGFPIDAVEEEVALASEEGAPTVAAAEEVVSAEEVEAEVEAVEAEVEAMGTEAEAVETEAEAMETEAEAVETEAEAMETEAEAVETEAEAADSNGSGGKRKRGRPAKGRAKSPSSAKKKEKGEEDVCFICFDGGNLVLCDRRGCPKAYHPSCVNRDEAFFRSKGRWNCGWHICSNCEKGAQFMCYTCTYSLCKGCMKESEFFCIRGNRGLCETCMRTVTLIEKSEHENKEMAQIDFNDKNSWEYLFKEYWMDLKGKLLLTSDEIAQAKNPLKGSGMPVQKEESSDELYDGNGDQDSHSDSSAGHTEVINPKKRKLKKRSKAIKGDSVSNDLRKVGTKGKATSNENEWASKELLDLVAHMKNGDTSMLSQFDVQALLLEYIKQNSLRDPRRKSQIVCDTRLEKLFGKPRVGHFEMLKLIELHFLVKEETPADDIQEDVSKESNQLDADANNDALPKVGTDKRRKTKKRGERAFQTNLDDYAAVDVHNINLLYLRRNLMEDLLEDGEKFHDKVVGSFVRIRISGAAQKQDMYRLVQVVGTRKAQESYKTGKRSTDVLLEILNLNKTEAITIDIISNQAFTEDECKRLRQSIKCGLIGRMTVGEVQDKALALQEVRVKDWLETEKARLSHLRDRASETGRRKELRECVEKLELLNKTEERQRRLQEIPEVHDDPNMDPNHESEEDEGEQDDKKQDYFNRQREAGLSRKAREPISPGKGSPVAVTWSGARKSPSSTWESSRNVPAKGAWEKGGSGDRTVDSLRSEGTDPHQSDSWGKHKNQSHSTGTDSGSWSGQNVLRSGSSSGIVAGTAVSPQPSGSEQSAAFSENDKIWHYKDPSGKMQGPFSMVQLRKWNTTGYFPVDLRIWRTTERQEDSILLTDALAGKFHKEVPRWNRRENDWSGGLPERTNSTWTDRNGIDRSWSSIGKDGSIPINGSNVSMRSDGRESGSSSRSFSATNLKVEQSAYPSRAWESSHGNNNAWSNVSMQSPGVSPNVLAPSHLAPFNQGEDARRWNSSQNSGSRDSSSGTIPQSNYGTALSVETPKFSSGGWAPVKGYESNLTNLPSPTPIPSAAGWNAQVSGQPATFVPEANPSAGSNLVHHTPSGAVGQSLDQFNSSSRPMPSSARPSRWDASPATAMNNNQNNSVGGPFDSQRLSKPWESGTNTVNPAWGIGVNGNPNSRLIVTPENPSVLLPQGNTNSGWRVPAQGNADSCWEAEAAAAAAVQTNKKTGEGTTQVDPNAAANAGVWDLQQPHREGGRHRWNRQSSFGSGGGRGGV